MNKFFTRMLCGVLCLCLLGSAALAEDAEEEVTLPSASEGAVYEDPEVLPEGADTSAATGNTTQYVAVSSVTLKIRREADKSSFGCGSIPKGNPIYILELGGEWCKVDDGSVQGYVQTKYLENIREYDASLGVAGDAAEAPAAESGESAAPSNSPADFKESFSAMTLKPAIIRKAMDERSGSVGKIKQYEEVVVSSNQGDWSYVRYNNRYGYVLTSTLFKWDRIDPFAGDIPGRTLQSALVFVNHSTNIMDYTKTAKKPLKTVNPGSALSVEGLDEQGRYYLPYWRTEGYINASDVSYVMNVVPWADAQSGDLISCMSTYYAVGKSTLQYQGRNWNIYLGSSMISGTVMQPGEQVNIYDVMGPYRKSTGYHKAPIMSPNALWGYGGGTCQVNTTLYNALIQVPILVNWRKLHANVGIYYAPVGLDAAVGGGDITMIFTNTLPYAVRLNFFMSDGVLTCGIFRL